MVNKMRKLDKAIIWPIYFDTSKTRKEGRRVPKNMAVQSPKIAEVKEAADKLGLANEIRLEAHFPKTHWAKSGMLLVEKKEAKEKIIQKIAKQLVKIKNQQQQQPIKH
jgi:signal recognition particle subunit SRP19